MKRLGPILAAIALLSGVAALTAYAAKPEAGYTPEQLKKGAAEAPDVIKAAGLSCEVKAAALAGGGETVLDKKKVKVLTYEVACTNGAGYLINKLDNGGSPISATCLAQKGAYEQAVADKKPVPPHCQLPENSDTYAYLRPVVSKVRDNCSIKSAAPVGKAGGNKTFYEVGCAEGGGFLLETDDKGDSSLALSCLSAAATLKYQCKTTTPEAELARVEALGHSQDPSCQANNARYMAHGKNGHEYYEIGCAGKPGFVLDTNNEKPITTVDCLSAGDFAGGCKFTDLAQAKAGAGSHYAEVLRANHVSCTPTDYKDFGHEVGGAGRELVEFRCPEAPVGLMTLIPAAGTSGKYQGYDCINAQLAFRRECVLTTKPMILSQLKSILTSVQKVCDPSAYRVVGRGGQGDWIEVRCANSGFMVEVRENRSPPPYETLTCEQASRPTSPTGPCELKG